MGNIDIAYIATHGFALRMLLQTDLLISLVKSNKSVALVTLQYDENLKTYCDKHDIVYQLYESKNSISHSYIKKRKYFTNNVHANSALKDKYMHDVWYTTSLNPFMRLRHMYWYLMNFLVPYLPKIKDRFLDKEKGKLNNDKAYEFLSKLSPRWLISTYPSSFDEGILLFNAKRIGTINTCIHLLSWDNISCKDYFVSLADKYIVWGNIMKTEFQKYYDVSPHQISACGVPHFDIHANNRGSVAYKARLRRYSLNKELPYILFAMSSPYFSPGEIDIVEYLSKEISVGVLKGKIQLIIRPHPQNVQGYMMNKSWLPRLKEVEALSHVTVDYPLLEDESQISWNMKKEDMNGVSELLQGASITINSGSTMAIDAFMHDKPVIFTSFDGYKNKPYWKSARRLINYPHLEKMIAFGGISVAHNYLELIELIEKYLRQPDYKRDERNLSLKEQLADTEGNSTTMVIKYLNKLCDQ